MMIELSLNHSSRQLVQNRMYDRLGERKLRKTP